MARPSSTGTSTAGPSLSKEAQAKILLRKELHIKEITRVFKDLLIETRLKSPRFQKIVRVFEDLLIETRLKSPFWKELRQSIVNPSTTEPSKCEILWRKELHLQEILHVFKALLIETRLKSPRFRKVLDVFEELLIETRLKSPLWKELRQSIVNPSTTGPSMSGSQGSENQQETGMVWI